MIDLIVLIINVIIRLFNRSKQDNVESDSNTFAVQQMAKANDALVKSQENHKQETDQKDPFGQSW